MSDESVHKRTGRQKTQAQARQERGQATSPRVQRAQIPDRGQRHNWTNDEAESVRAVRFWFPLFESFRLDSRLSTPARGATGTCVRARALPFEYRNDTIKNERRQRQQKQQHKIACLGSLAFTMASITAQDGLDMQTNSGYQYFLRDRRPDVPANNAATPRAPAISEETLLRRRAFRDSMQRETCEHRLVHSHERAGRSILQVLSDRARWGSSHVVWPPCRAAASASLSARKGSESPSTVCDMSPTEKQRPATLATAPCSISAEIALFAEQTAAVRYAASFLGHLGGDDELQHGQRPASSRAVSTISVAFSPDAATMASTHGDHSVKISCCATGRLLQTLHGHPRTPWTVKYHPNNSQIVASGCLGHQVRVWNWVSKQCLQMVRLEYAIISLSFHPSGQLLAVANGTRLHFWGVDDYEDGNTSNNTSEGQITTPPTQQRQQPTRSQLLTEMDQRHMLRCVHFPPNGRSIIIGGVNPYNDDASARRRNRPTMSFYLRLWDFELSKALCLDPTTQDTVMAASIHGSPAGVGIVKRAISQVSNQKQI